MRKIELTQGKYTVVDEEDYDRISKHKWYFDSSNGYARNGELGYLHRFILQPPKGKYVDHKDKDKLNNRRSNLRVCTNAENIRNSSVRVNNTSGATGVWWRSDRNRWVAEIKLDYKKITIGRYKTKDEAVEARRQKEIELFGEFSPNKENVKY